MRSGTSPTFKQTLVRLASVARLRWRARKPTPHLFWPHLVFTVRHIQAANATAGTLGATYGPFIFLHANAQHFAGVLIHEQQHVRQWWWSLLGLTGSAMLLFFVVTGDVHFFASQLFGFLGTSLVWRLPQVSEWVEVDASRQELRYFDCHPEIAWHLAERLSYCYGFGTPQRLYRRLVRGTPLE